jgi:hypothetical protein
MLSLMPSFRAVAARIAACQFSYSAFFALCLLLLRNVQDRSTRTTRPRRRFDTGAQAMTIRAEDKDDIENVEAWAEIFRDILHLIPQERRAQVSRIANSPR